MAPSLPQAYEQKSVSVPRLFAAFAAYRNFDEGVIARVHDWLVGDDRRPMLNGSPVGPALMARQLCDLCEHKTLSHEEAGWILGWGGIPGEVLG